MMDSRPVPVAGLLAARGSTPGTWRFNTGHVVYHDDFGDYSTNEPIMDGTANLVYIVSALAGL